MAENRQKIPVSGYNPRTKELFFSWRESDAGDHAAATPDRTLVFNLEYGHASYLDHGFTAMVNYQSYNQMSLRDFLIEELSTDKSICDCDDSSDDIIQGIPYAIGRDENTTEYDSVWNSQENTGSCSISAHTDEWNCVANGGNWTPASASSTSLCTGLGTKGFEFFCEEGTEGSVFVMASSEDNCLKEYSEDYYKRDIYSSAGNGSYSFREYESVLESGALHFDTDNEKTLQRITLEYTGVTSDVVTASMKFGKANQPGLLLAGASYTDLTGVELLNYQSSASTSDIEANLISPDDKAYFNNYTRGRYLGYQLKLTGAGPATITRLTLSTRLAEK
jgi:hypothetical protein|tara:strand:- start:10 stop:1014 length:1005 start_codon:yes stop_codon:yes gene_type:complete